ncbi:uncharacterized protein C16orf86 homolog [Erinaceus europaeus]|uniref:Uncharacterized protein C16orf86 homolog n=1 Tax=Erinaceus europaeus TaxID=9365 RepID=A0ABM3WXI9_ERIEU|nr:uncharacterized protein C16orf86 homolog [Erinaceus europaeus]
MASAETERLPGSQEGTSVGLPQLAEATVGQAQSSECPVTGDLCLVPAHEACWPQSEDKCPSGSVSEPELQDGRLKSEEESVKPEVEAPEERGSRPAASVVRPSHGPKRKPANLPGPIHQAHSRAEADLPLRKEEPEGSQSEPSPSTKHKKAKKRKNLGTPVLSAVTSTVSTPPDTLGLERKVQRLRPLYQYINYLNPELNQTEEVNGEAEAEVEPESEVALAPEAGVEQLQALLPVVGELGPGLALPCASTIVSPTQILVPPGEESGGLPNLGVSGCLKAEVDKSTQVDINKMLSVCAAPLVPPLSPQYK